MNSALVRRDPVMLHDPLRTHSRATVVGVVLSMVGLLGFLIFGILKPNAKPPQNGGIVIGKESGQIYVYTDKPEKLIPTFNLASARLLIMAREQKAQQGAQGGGQEAPQVVQPTFVPDDQLAGIPRGRKQGLPDADVLLPTASQRISDDWAVCHNLPMNSRLPEEPRMEEAKTNQQTAVLAGRPGSKLGTPLKDAEAILVERADGKQFLIYRPEEDANRKSDVVLSEIPTEGPGAAAVKQALQLSNARPRPMSLGLLNSMPPGPPLVPPVPDGLDTPTSYNVGDGQVANVGDVFSAELAGKTEFYVILNEGKQKVTQAVATMILLEHTTKKVVPPIEADLLRGIPDAPEASRLKVADYPAQLPIILDPLRYPTTCLGWALTGTGANRDGRTTMYVGSELPFPKDKNGQPQMLQVGKANEEKIAVNFFYMPSGRGAVVHATTGRDSNESGPIQLIGDNGLRYGIPNQITAQYLGLTNIRPAPEKILKLLATGSSLNSQNVTKAYDSIETAPGSGDYQGQDTGQTAAGTGG